MLVELAGLECNHVPAPVQLERFMRGTVERADCCAERLIAFAPRFSKYSLGFEVSAIIWAILALLVLIFVLWRRWDKPIQTVEVNISLGGIGIVRLTPTWEDVQIAHQIWTELVTRKAAIPFDPENDVIAEIYD